MHASCRTEGSGMPYFCVLKATLIAFDTMGKDTTFHRFEQ